MHNSKVLHCKIHVRQCWTGPLSANARRMRWILLVASTSFIIDEGVLDLLERQHDYRVAVVAFVDDAGLLDDITAIRPAVILLHEDGPLSLDDMLSLMRHAPTLAKTRIITYGIQTNSVEGNDYRCAFIIESQDFLSAISSAGQWAKTRTGAPGSNRLQFGL